MEVPGFGVSDIAIDLPERDRLTGVCFGSDYMFISCADDVWVSHRVYISECRSALR